MIRKQGFYNSIAKINQSGSLNL